MESALLSAPGYHKSLWCARREIREASILILNNYCVLVLYFHFSPRGTCIFNYVVTYIASLLNVLLRDSLGGEGPCLAPLLLHPSSSPRPWSVAGAQRMRMWECMNHGTSLSLRVSPGQKSHPVGLSVSPGCGTQQAFGNVGFCGIGLEQCGNTHKSKSSLSLVFEMRQVWVKWREKVPSEFRATYVTPLGLCFIICEMGMLKPAFWASDEGLNKT